MLEENIEEFRLSYDDLKENCAGLNNQLNIALIRNNDLEKENLMAHLSYLKQINILQDQIIALQLELMAGSDA